MKLSTGGKDNVTFPSSAMARLQFSPKVEEPDDETPTLTLSNEDQLVGVLTGKLKLETAFDTLNLEAAQIKALRHAKGSVQDVQVTLWDETTVSGQLSDTELACALRCGVNMKVPVALVEEYNQPAPSPSEAMVKKVTELVAELNADDWKARDRAEARLVGMGQIVAATLKQLRGAQAAEAQQRIDSVLKQLGSKPDPATAPSTPATEPGAANPPAPNAPPAAVPQVEIIKG
jgi:hypothetical protein